LRLVFNVLKVLKEEGEPRGISEAAIREAAISEAAIREAAISAITRNTCPEGANRIFVL